MEKKIAKDFQSAVNSIVEEDERESLYSTLRAYHQSMDVAWLVDRLISLVDRPSRRPLFDHVRKLIPPKQQMLYDGLLPCAAAEIEARLRVVRLATEPERPVGFAIRGGFEHGVGFFVSQVEKDSMAHHRGLRPGDQVVRINGFCVDESVLSEVVQLVRLEPRLTLKVRTVGMVPVKDSVDADITWSYSEQSRNRDVYRRGRAGIRFRDIRIFFHKPENVTLGCNIYCGSENEPGIFVQSIRVGSIAEDIGLDVDDEILSVNGADFRQLRYSEAVVNLKAPLQLNMVVRRKLKDSSKTSEDDSLMANIRRLELERVAQLRTLAADLGLEKSGRSIPLTNFAEEDRLRKQFEEQRWLEEEEQRMTMMDAEREADDKRLRRREAEEKNILDRMEALLDGAIVKRVETNSESDVEALEAVMTFGTEKDETDSETIAVVPDSMAPAAPPGVPPVLQTLGSIPLETSSSSPISPPSSGEDFDRDSQREILSDSTTLPETPVEPHSQLHRFLTDVAERASSDKDADWLYSEKTFIDKRTENDDKNKKPKEMREKIERSALEDRSIKDPLSSNDKTLKAPPRLKAAKKLRGSLESTNSADSTTIPKLLNMTSSSETTPMTRGTPSIDSLTPTPGTPESSLIPQNEQKPLLRGDNLKSPPEPSPNIAPSLSPQIRASATPTVASSANVKRQPSIPVAQGPLFSSTQRPILVKPSTEAQARGTEAESGQKSETTTPFSIKRPAPNPPNAKGGNSTSVPKTAETSRPNWDVKKSRGNVVKNATKRDSDETTPPQTNVDGRVIKVVNIVKNDDPLDITIEGGWGSAWDGKVVVSHVWEGGAIHKNGGMKTGDQLLMVEGVSLNGVSLSQAQTAIKRAMRSPKEIISFVIAVAEENRSEIKL